MNCGRGTKTIQSDVSIVEGCQFWWREEKSFHSRHHSLGSFLQCRVKEMEKAFTGMLWLKDNYYLSPFLSWRHRTPPAGSGSIFTFRRTKNRPPLDQWHRLFFFCVGCCRGLLRHPRPSAVPPIPQREDCNCGSIVTSWPVCVTLFAPHITDSFDVTQRKHCQPSIYIPI